MNDANQKLQDHGQTNVDDSQSGITNQWPPILTLVLVTVIVPELLTGSTPLPAFLNPIMVAFLILGYGLPVLLIREVATRYRIGLRGLVFCGLAYGIFNEGILAKTNLLETNIPIAQFDGYGYAMGIAWPWMVFISVWHCFASVVFPIALTHYLLPSVSRQAWVRSKTVIWLGILVIAIGCLIFFSDTRGDGVIGSLFQMGIFGCLMVALFAMAIVFKGRCHETCGTPSWMAACLGMSVIVPFILLSALAGSKANLVIFFSGFAGVVAIYWRILRQNGWLSPPGSLSFAVGWYFQTAVVSVLVILGNPLLAAASALVDIVILVLLWRLTQTRQLLMPDDGVTAVQ